MSEKPADTTHTSFGGGSLFSRFTSSSKIFSPGKSKITIQLLDDEESIQHDFKKNSTGQEILDYVCSYLDIVEKDYFGLRYQDPHNKFRYWVDLSKPIAKQFSSTSSITLRFRIRFYPEDPFVLKEEITRYQLFVQLRRDLLHGRLHCSQHESATLAALILQSVLGDYNPNEHPPGYVSQYKLLLKQYDRLEEKVAELHQEFKGMTPADAEAEFLKIASRLDTYGFDPYVVRDAKQNVEVIIGVTCRGILIYLKNVKVHYLHWKDLSKVDYFGKQLRIYPTLAYLEKYQQTHEHVSLGDTLLNATLSDTEDEDPKKKAKTLKKTQFKLTCPSSEYSKHLWKHILSQQVFFTEDQAKMVKPKFSKPRIPLISRGSTFRCPTKRVLHEIATDATLPREQPPANFTRYQIPKGPPRSDMAASSANKFGTMPAMHIKSRPRVQPIEEEQTTRTPSSPTTTQLENTTTTSISTTANLDASSSVLASEISNLNTNLSSSAGTISSSNPVKTTTIRIHLVSTENFMDDIHKSFAEAETERLFEQLRSSTPIVLPEHHIEKANRQELDLGEEEKSQKSNVSGKDHTNGIAKTNGQIPNGHLPNGSTKFAEGADRNSRASPSIGRQLVSWIFGLLLLLMLLVIVCVVAFESPAVSESKWLTSLPYVDDFRHQVYEPARTQVLTNYKKMVSRF